MVLNRNMLHRTIIVIWHGSCTANENHSQLEIVIDTDWSVCKTGKRCPYCRCKIDWKKLGPSEEELTSIGGDGVIQLGQDGPNKRFIVNGTRYKIKER